MVRQANGIPCTAVGFEPRLVGDELTNPDPSFVGSTVNKMLFFRNRLAILSGENIVLSQPGDYFNFWANSALTVSPQDSIDISA